MGIVTNVIHIGIKADTKSRLYQAVPPPEGGCYEAHVVGKQYKSGDKVSAVTTEGEFNYEVRNKLGLREKHSGVALLNKMH